MIIGLIPSRLNSKRLKEKPLLKIDGLAIIVHSFKRAKLAKKLDKVINQVLLFLINKHVVEVSMVKNGFLIKEIYFLVYFLLLTKKYKPQD